MPLKTIEELRDIAYSIVGEPEKVQFGDRIVGIIEARDGTVMDVVRGYPDERSAYVGLLMVDGAWHGRGVGTLIMRAELRRLRAEGLSRVRLAYIEGNEPARKFWAKLGFEPTGEVASTPHYVAVLMERVL